MIQIIDKQWLTNKKNTIRVLKLISLYENLKKKNRCYFTAIVSISIKALSGNPLTAKAALAGGSAG